MDYVNGFLGESTYIWWPTVGKGTVRPFWVTGGDYLIVGVKAISVETRHQAWRSMQSRTGSLIKTLGTPFGKQNLTCCYCKKYSITSNVSHQGPWVLSIFKSIILWLLLWVFKFWTCRTFLIKSKRKLEWRRPQLSCGSLSAPIAQCPGVRYEDILIFWESSTVFLCFDTCLWNTFLTLSKPWSTQHRLVQLNAPAENARIAPNIWALPLWAFTNIGVYLSPYIIVLLRIATV